MKKYIFFVFALFGFGLFLGNFYGQRVARRIDVVSLYSRPEMRLQVASMTADLSRSILERKVDSLLRSTNTDTLIVQYLRTLPLCSSAPLNDVPTSVILRRRR